MFDELYPEAADTALKARAARPVEAAPVKFSAWGLATSAPRGVAAGAAQGVGSAADILGAFGRVMAATDARPGGMFSTSAPTTLSDLITGESEQDRAHRKLVNEGIDYRSEAGALFRNVARDYRPDPATTHAAEQVVFDIARVGSKAITAAVAMGNVPGAVAAGMEEGFSQADDLAQQGVDLATRTKVGAVTAVTNAASFALPVAGKTWQQTVGLALAGGPVGFMAQNAATREILKSADYSKLAEQYDPLDPVGLALSTVIPLGFGALAMRGARGAKVAADGAPVKDSAPVERAVDTPKAPDDVVDAARVALLRENVDRTNPAPDSIPAQDAHVKAYDQAIDQMSAGERVMVDVPEAVAVKATEAMAPRIEEFTAAVRESGLMPAARAADGMADAGRVVDAPAGVVDVRPVEPAAKSADQPITPESIAADVRKIIESDPLAPKPETAQPEATPMQRAAERVMQEQPNMVIRLEGDEVSRPVAEVMAEMKAAHDADVQDSGLLQVAAECFIETLGGAL